MAALNTSQLECMINCEPLLKRSVKGVFPADCIPPLHTDEGMIINTEPHNSDGEHWIAVYNVNNYIEVFDSFGQMSSKGHINFASIARNKPLRFNRMSIQCTDSLFCGYYCIFYLYCKVHNMSFDSFLNVFQKSCKLNDAYVLSFVLDKFSLCLFNHV